MPFPLAHPAAVLPFRRFCPHRLSFAALLIGSIVPDVAYSIDDLNKFSSTFLFLFGSMVKNWESVRNGWDWDDFSHTFAGSIIFCLPVGLMLCAIFWILRSAITAILPNPHREVLRAAGEKFARPSFFSITISLLFGIWLHIAWDCFTNSDRSSGEQWAFLRFQVINHGSFQLELERLIWWCSSLGGMAALLVVYVRFLRRQKASLWVFTQAETKYYLIWSGMLVASALIATPLTLQFIDPQQSWENFFGFAHRFSGYFLTCLCGSIVLVSVFLKLRPFQSTRH